MKSAEVNRTIAIVDGSEFESIKEAFEGIFHEINTMVSSGKLTVNNKEENLDFFLGGDYNFIFLMLGLKGAISNYARCKVHKKDCWNIETLL